MSNSFVGQVMANKGENTFKWKCPNCAQLTIFPPWCNDHISWVHMFRVVSRGCLLILDLWVLSLLQRMLGLNSACQWSDHMVHTASNWSVVTQINLMVCGIKCWDQFDPRVLFSKEDAQEIQQPERHSNHVPMVWWDQDRPVGLTSPGCGSNQARSKKTSALCLLSSMAVGVSWFGRVQALLAVGSYSFMIISLWKLGHKAVLLNQTWTLLS